MVWFFPKLMTDNKPNSPPPKKREKPTHIDVSYYHIQTVKQNTNSWRKSDEKRHIADEQR